jgi:hypothetical protein
MVHGAYAHAYMLSATFTQNLQVCLQDGPNYTKRFPTDSNILSTVQPTVGEEEEVLILTRHFLFGELLVQIIHAILEERMSTQSCKHPTAQSQSITTLSETRSAFNVNGT